MPHFADPEGPRRNDGRTVVAFAGIARPERFFNALRSLDYDVVRELTFRDHHWYTAHDIETIQSAARDTDASLIVTTEKDAVRCNMGVAVLPMTVSIEPQVRFVEWLMARLSTSLPKPQSAQAGTCPPKPRSGEGG